eukprot:1654703-Ditylum_brightwellii.AAC.2
MEDSLILYATGPLSDLLGYCADTPFAEQLRDGTADIELLETDRYYKKFLEELHYKPTDPP